MFQLEVFGGFGGHRGRESLKTKETTPHPCLYFVRFAFTRQILLLGQNLSQIFNRRHGERFPNHQMKGRISSIGRSESRRNDAAARFVFQLTFFHVFFLKALDISHRTQHVLSMVIWRECSRERRHLPLQRRQPNRRAPWRENRAVGKMGKTALLFLFFHLNAHFHLIWASTHWLVTEDGRIQGQVRQIQHFTRLYSLRSGKSDNILHVNIACLLALRGCCRFVRETNRSAAKRAKA